jgi:hypothetical protein
MTKAVAAAAAAAAEPGPTTSHLEPLIAALLKQGQHALHLLGQGSSSGSSDLAGGRVIQMTAATTISHDDTAALSSMTHTSMPEWTKAD